MLPLLRLSLQTRIYKNGNRIEVSAILLRSRPNAFDRCVNCPDARPIGSPPHSTIGADEFLVLICASTWPVLHYPQTCSHTSQFKSFLVPSAPATCENTLRHNTTTATEGSFFGVPSRRFRPARIGISASLAQWHSGAFRSDDPSCAQRCQA